MIRPLADEHREDGLILAGFDRRTMAMHAGKLTREGAGHAGIILFRRRVSQMDYGKQARLLVEFWQEAKGWDWADRIEYLPRTETRDRSELAKTLACD